MFGYKYSSSMSDIEIEEKARNLGMHTSEECKVFFERDDNQ